GKALRSQEKEMAQTGRRGENGRPKGCYEPAGPYRVSRISRDLRSGLSRRVRALRAGADQPAAHRFCHRRDDRRYGAPTAGPGSPATASAVAPSRLDPLGAKRPCGHHPTAARLGSVARGRLLDPLAIAGAALARTRREGEGKGRKGDATQ